MKLSIITVNYNNRDGLLRTIESILSQTWKQFEWILIDGGSTDGSRELIEKYKEHFAFWCSEPDSGAYHAMNKGIQHAKGEYLNFMNSGDVFNNDKTLEDVFSHAFHEDFVYGDWIRIEKDGEVLLHAPEKVSLDFFYTDNICHQAIFVKTPILKTSGFDERFRIYADWARWIKMILDNCSTKYIPLVVCRFDARCGLSNQDLKKLDLEKESMRDTIPHPIREVLDKNCDLQRELNKYEHILAVKDTYSLTVERPLYSKLIHHHLVFVKRIKKIVDYFCK